MGEFVRSASSTIEAPVARKLRQELPVKTSEAPAEGGSKPSGASKPGAKAAPKPGAKAAPKPGGKPAPKPTAERAEPEAPAAQAEPAAEAPPPSQTPQPSKSQDRKSTRLNSSHVAISYAVFCLKKKRVHGSPRAHRLA